MRACTRWEEIKALALSACDLGRATGTLCEFHLLNPIRGFGSAVSPIEGQDWVATRGAAGDRERLRSFLERVTPAGVTPLAERLRALRPRC